MLSVATEIQVADSIRIETEGWSLQRLDSTDVKKWFAPLLGSINNNRLKNRSYFLAGKITTHPDYNLLILLEEKKKSDTSSSTLVHLVTVKKDGHYITSVVAAVTGTKKRTNFNTLSTIYSGMLLRKYSNFVVNEKAHSEIEVYQVNSSGRFILTANQ